MWRVRACLLLAATCLALACSSQQEPLPPELGGCSGDASCTPPSVGGGGAGGGAGDAAAAPDGASCGVEPSASQCDQCAAGQCCAGLVSCTSSSQCNDLLTCIFNCPTTACVTVCKQMFSTGVQAYQALESCLQLRCPICAESGAGDPCTPSSCVPGLTCQALGCTKACTKDADCVGIGPSGGNILGKNNVCIATASGPQCAPGCSIEADCSYFPGTYCHSTLSYTGANVQVCAFVQDASTD